MDATPHLVVGAALAMRRSPLVAFAVGAASHVLLDVVPHYHYGWVVGGFSPGALIDMGAGVCLVVGIVLVAPNSWGALAGAAGGIFPDIQRALSGNRYDLFRLLPVSLPHWEVGLPWGLVTQIVATGIALAIAVRARRRGRGKHRKENSQLSK